MTLLDEATLSFQPSNCWDLSLPPLHEQEDWVVSQCCCLRSGSCLFRKAKVWKSLFLVTTLLPFSCDQTLQQSQSLIKSSNKQSIPVFSSLDSGLALSSSSHHLPSPSSLRMKRNWLQCPSPASGALISLAETLTRVEKIEKNTGRSWCYAPEIMCKISLCPEIQMQALFSRRRPLCSVCGRIVSPGLGATTHCRLFKNKGKMYIWNDNGIEK